MNRSARYLEPVTINNTNIEIVPSGKLLDVKISNDLKWNVHVEMICKKVATCLYFLRQLKPAKVPTNDLLSFYTTCIRPFAEYACPVFHTALPQYLSDQLEVNGKGKGTRHSYLTSEVPLLSREYSPRKPTVRSFYPPLSISAPF